MCRKCVEDQSDTGMYSWRNADPEDLEPPNGEMQPIVDRMEEGDYEEEMYEAWLDSQDQEVEEDYEEEDDDLAGSILGEAESFSQASAEEQAEDAQFHQP